MFKFLRVCGATPTAPSWASTTAPHAVNQVPKRDCPTSDDKADHQVLNPIQTGDHQVLNPIQTGDHQVLNPIRTGDHQVLNPIQTGDHQVLNPIQTEDHQVLNPIVHLTGAAAKAVANNHNQQQVLQQCQNDGPRVRNRPAAAQLVLPGLGLCTQSENEFFRDAHSSMETKVILGTVSLADSSSSLSTLSPAANISSSPCTMP